MFLTLVLIVSVLSLVLATWVDRQVHNQIVQIRERKALEAYLDRNN